MTSRSVTASVRLAQHRHLRDSSVGSNLWLTTFFYSLAQTPNRVSDTGCPRTRSVSCSEGKVSGIGFHIHGADSTYVEGAYLFQDHDPESILYWWPVGNYNLGLGKQPSNSISDPCHVCGVPVLPPAFEVGKVCQQCAVFSPCVISQQARFEGKVTHHQERCKGGGIEATGIVMPGPTRKEFWAGGRCCSCPLFASGGFPSTAFICDWDTASLVWRGWGWGFDGNDLAMRTLRFILCGTLGWLWRRRWGSELARWGG